jgi:hypothetical protein
VIGQDRQYDEKTEECGHLVLLEVNENTVRHKKYCVKKFLAHTLDVYIGPEGKQENKDSVNKNLQ